jgi:cobalt/nickel transport system ATP-binding protein
VKAPLLELKNLTIRRGGKEILKDFNLKIYPGEKLLIVGPNGVGKTSLAETVLGFVPFEGEITFKGKRISSEEDFKELRKRVGYVFQNPDDQLFMPTVEEELRFGPENLGFDPESIEKNVKEISKLLNIEHLIHRNTFELSFGQKRLVSIACVLTMEPELLILDEPTNGLDPKNWNTVVKFLKESEKTFLVITHDEKLIKKLGWRALSLSSGELLENCF